MLRALGFDTAFGLHFDKLSAALNRRALASSWCFMQQLVLHHALVSQTGQVGGSVAQVLANASSVCCPSSGGGCSTSVRYSITHSFLGQMSKHLSAPDEREESKLTKEALLSETRRASFICHRSRDNCLWLTSLGSGLAPPDQRNRESGEPSQRGHAHPRRKQPQLVHWHDDAADAIGDGEPWMVWVINHIGGRGRTSHSDSHRKPCRIPQA